MDEIFRDPNLAMFLSDTFDNQPVEQQCRTLFENTTKAIIEFKKSSFYNDYEPVE
jgi:hypothetical protein